MKLQTRKIISFLTALTLLLAVALPAGAAKTPDVGAYSVKSTLSCFVDAMGGQEFGAKLYKGAKITVDKNGSAKATLTINSDIPTQSFETEGSSNVGSFFAAIKRFFDSILNFFCSLFGAK
ncbi:MAG: hypothetical protein IJU56_05800 [Clostridia bacterium]|nr:hypothetical protein [Clostridia bacterium]